MQRFTVETEADGIHAVTGAVSDAVAASPVSEGVCVVFCQHTSASIIINEHDSALETDVRKKLYDLVPHDSEADYEHGRHEHEPNAHAHLKTLLTGNSLTIPVTDGELALGTYQDLLLLDFDGPRDRTILVQCLSSEPT